MQSVYQSHDLATKLRSVRAVIFDWDGVFNDGAKGPDMPSAFSERDSMGTNMLRYALWKQIGTVPLTMVVSGANNHIARYLAGREHFHYEVSGALFKADIVRKVIGDHGVREEEVVFFYDDILDLSVAEFAGVRCQIRYRSSPMLNAYVDQHRLADCWVLADQPTGQLRQLCDMLVSHIEGGDSVIADRSSFSEDYQRYFAERQSIETVHGAARTLLGDQSDKYLTR